MELILDALIVVFQPINLLLMTAGVFIGIIFGAIPGLTATLAIALLVPFTFNMAPVPALLLLLGIYNGGMFGGSITAITIRTPGAPAAAVTVLDGYPMAQRGEAGLAIGTACISSTCGGLISAALMILLSPLLAKVALKFSPVEYCAIGVFGLTAVFAISGKSLLKGALAALFGLLLSTIGLDPILPVPRFTFGEIELAGGIPFLPAVIGLFALAEVFRLVGAKENPNQVIDTNVGKVLPNIENLKKILRTSVKGSLIGTAIGILPGAGGTIASYVSYGEAKRSAKNPETFGTGIVEGVAAAESANNAVSGGAMIPMLTLGIPGDAVTAVLLGALVIQGMQPGPTLFQEQIHVIYPVFIGMLLSNFIMLICGLLIIKPVSYVAKIKKQYLVPIVAVFSLVGAFAESGSILMVAFAIAFGVVGYVMEKYHFPVAPVVLALILGPMIENALRQSLIMSQGDWSIFITRPISAVLLLISALTIITVFRRKNINS